MSSLGQYEKTFKSKENLAIIVVLASKSVNRVGYRRNSMERPPKIAESVVTFFGT